MSPHVRDRTRELGTSGIGTTRSAHLLNSDARLAQRLQRLQDLRHMIHDAAKDVGDMVLRVECLSAELLASWIWRSLSER
jgi:hypothetical protein